MALVAGIVVVVDMLGSRKPPVWTALFFVTAIATSATGFLFRGVPFGIAHWLGVISLIAIFAAILALSVFHLAGAWRWIYVLGVVISTYLLVLVTIVQAFEKVRALAALAPTQSEPSFTITQLVALVIFVVLAITTAIKFRPNPQI